MKNKLQWFVKDPTKMRHNSLLPWVRRYGWVTSTPLIAHLAPGSGTSVTAPLWFSKTQCSL